MFLLLLIDCDGDSDPSTNNGSVMVYNQTDQPIYVYYEEQTKNGVEERNVQIIPDGYENIYVFMEFYEAEILVYYNQIRKEYKISFDVIFENASVTVKIEDFHNNYQ